MASETEQARRNAMQVVGKDFEEFSKGHPLLADIFAPVVLCPASPKPMAADEAAFNLVIKALTTEGTEGWARFRSGVFSTAGVTAPDFGEYGPPLRAEWTDGKAESVLLGPDPDRSGSLILRRFTTRPLVDGDPLKPDERAYLRTTETALGNPRHLPDHDLAYHVFFGNRDGDDPNAIARVLSLFAGFIPAQKEGKS